MVSEAELVGLIDRAREIINRQEYFDKAKAEPILTQLLTTDPFLKPSADELLKSLSKIADFFVVDVGPFQERFSELLLELEQVNDRDGQEVKAVETKILSLMDEIKTFLLNIYLFSEMERWNATLSPEAMC